MVRAQTDLGQLARLVGSRANRCPRTLFAAIGADPSRSEKRAALADANVVANSVDLHLFQPFPSCIENSHDSVPYPCASTAFWPILKRMVATTSSGNHRARLVPTEKLKLALVALVTFAGSEA
jgi:hypothetical protein